MRYDGWCRQRADEKLVEPLPRGGDLRLALAYANSYHVGMSSLSFQRVYELVQSFLSAHRFTLTDFLCNSIIQMDRRGKETICRKGFTGRSMWMSTIV